MADIFDAKNKKSTMNGGEIYKFRAYTVGARFAGTYLGFHTWMAPDMNNPGQQKEVIAHDFANCTIDGVKRQEEEKFTINGTAALNSIMENVVPGQIVGLEYAGLGQKKPGRNAPHVFIPYVDAAMVDPNWQRLVDSSSPAAPATAGQAPTASFFNAAPPAAAADEPFPSGVQDPYRAIMDIAKAKLGAVDENDAKLKVMEATQLPFLAQNHAAILVALKAKVGMPA